MSTSDTNGGVRGDGAAVVDEASVVRIGAVSYLNTLPLIEGLAKAEGAALTLTAPADLIGVLEDGTVDLALASTIDYLRCDKPLAVVPVGMIGCDGPTMTVRLFSKGPIDGVKVVHADVDSHTSVALLRVVLAERWGVAPAIEAFDADAHRAAQSSGGQAWPEALLLIGDKVVTDSPPAVHYRHQLDLGEAWHALTGLPFVYAAWMCLRERAGDPSIGLAAALLDRQRRHNAMRLGWIAREAASRRGWPGDVAVRYVTELLRYDFDARAGEGLTRFFELCAKHGLSGEDRPLVFAGA